MILGKAEQATSRKPIVITNRVRPDADYIAQCANGQKVFFTNCGKCHLNGVFCQCDGGVRPPSGYGKILSVKQVLKQKEYVYEAQV